MVYSLVLLHKSPAWHSYALVCHLYVLVCHPYVIRMSLVFTRMYTHVILMYLHVTRMPLVCSRMSPVFTPMYLPLTYNNSVYGMIFYELCVLTLSGDWKCQLQLVFNTTKECSVYQDLKSKDFTLGYMQFYEFPSVHINYI